ncbi:beta-ketoacyl-[acyl-carrier-protein] synthase family protein [Micromonospora sp. WMMD1120]|uniref:beta-ketoacyl-[acyl-carrier-protein] synthase family protein n=1 Tax=Micromonospora sp. WMMD1120 TaxID=3016106 RepID=UPI002416D4C9|nr:beta-ketoacyl-[acyl-carrier-protein] synthase family protein [Micromonospora sp. WMMD1120]MDG4807573.1 beta-ketoacyl-[acyl-carrier-protein] synthase family protein [Micromonospora sp. WMMD1120]
MSDRARVAITGLGVKSPAGNSVDEVFAAMLGARSTAVVIESLITDRSPVTFGCPVPPFDLDAYLHRREQRKTHWTSHLALAAVADAVADAGLTSDAVDLDRLGVHVGTTASGLAPTIQVVKTYADEPAAMPVYTVSKIMPNSVAAGIGLQLGARGPYQTVATACASGTTAIGEAALQIRNNALDVVVAGGADASIEAMTMASFAKAGALSRRHDDPARASRPFDADRDGFVMGEGAAFFVLERWEHAVARGARILGEVAGYAANSDAFHIVAPRADGEQAAACMRRAIRDAGLEPGDVGHVNAHGTSTQLNDRAEALALGTCFGAAVPPVTANKGVVGHLLGAAGAFEALVALVSSARGSVPPVANFTGGPDADLIDIVAKEPRAVRPAPVLSNSFGFGGHNACLVLTPTAV